MRQVAPMTNSKLAFISIRRQVYLRYLAVVSKAYCARISLVRKCKTKTLKSLQKSSKVKLTLSCTAWHTKAKTRPYKAGMRQAKVKQLID